MYNYEEYIKRTWRGNGAEMMKGLSSGAVTVNVTRGIGEQRPPTENEVSDCGEAIEEALKSDTTVAVTIHGSPGSGKSTLSQRLCAWFQGKGLVAVQANADGGKPNWKEKRKLLTKGLALLSQMIREKNPGALIVVLLDMNGGLQAQLPQWKQHFPGVPVVAIYPENEKKSSREFIEQRDTSVTTPPEVPESVKVLINGLVTASGVRGTQVAGDVFTGNPLFWKLIYSVCGETIEPDKAKFLGKYRPHTTLNDWVIYEKMHNESKSRGDKEKSFATEPTQHQFLMINEEKEKQVCRYKRDIQTKLEKALESVSSIEKKIVESEGKRKKAAEAKLFKKTKEIDEIRRVLKAMESTDAI